MAKVVFTAGRVSGFKCAPDKQQAFLWDVTAPGLGLRATPAGKPAYIFQSRYLEQSVRLTIGSPDVWSIDQARTKAKDLQRLIDDGKDPRDLKRDNLQAKAREAAAVQAQAAAEAAAAVTVGEVWQVYIAERKPHWGDRHYLDHIAMIRAGGVSATRGTKGRGVTVAGPLHPLMSLPLRDLDSAAVEAWAASEAKTRPTVARLAWRCLKAFLTWCAEQPQYTALVAERNPAKSKKAREALGKPGIKQDALLKEQLPAWFAAVRNMSNQTISAYLQVMLLTGARPSEVLELQWDDINTKWHGLTIRDKVEGTRVIPLTPYVSHLVHALPRRNQYVFASNPRGGAKKTAPLSHPNVALATVSKVAGIDGLTLHGLRRSFKSLTEWLEIPAGVVAQLMRHKPSATAEKHYTVRPLDLLRVHHEKIEAWILEQAGVAFDRAAEPGKLRVVSA